MHAQEAVIVLKQLPAHLKKITGFLPAELLEAMTNRLEHVKTRLNEDMLGHVGFWVEACPVKHTISVLKIEVVFGNGCIITLGLVGLQDCFLKASSRPTKIKTHKSNYKIEGSNSHGFTNNFHIKQLEKLLGASSATPLVVAPWAVCWPAGWNQEGNLQEYA